MNEQKPKDDAGILEFIELPDPLPATHPQAGNVRVYLDDVHVPDAMLASVSEGYIIELVQVKLTDMEREWARYTRRSRAHQRTRFIERERRGKVRIEWIMPEAWGDDEDG